jgi:hypothetical protein
MKGTGRRFVAFFRDPFLFDYLGVIAFAVLSVVMIIKTW